MTNSTEIERTGRYTKKPVTIEAVQWFKHGDHPDVRAVTDGDHLYFTGMGGTTLKDAHLYGVVGTLESPNHLVTPGDWIIRGVKGELYPCKPDVFAATYEPEQAARRAPVVPHGWKMVPVEATFGMLNAMHGICGENGKANQSKIDEADRKYAAMLAAAPQPPEVTPVQMPEPVGCATTMWGVAWNTSVMEAGTPLYTDQQVRQLLAEHCIK